MTVGAGKNLSSIVCSESDVLEALYDLDPSKAKGIDGIGPNVLKHCALALYQPLHHLFNKSLVDHCLPTEWRIHNITPIFKSGDRACVSNYRPISLLCCASKVLERIIFKSTYGFLE